MRIRVLSVVASLAVALSVFSGVVQAQQSQTGNQAIAGLIDVVVNNTQILNQALNDNNVLNNALNNNVIRVVNLNDTLNGNQTNVLSDILNQSNVLSGNTVIVRDVLQNFLNSSLNNNEVLKNFLNQNNIAVDRVVAVDLLSAPVTIYVFEPR